MSNLTVHTLTIDNTHFKFAFEYGSLVFCAINGQSLSLDRLNLINKNIDNFTSLKELGEYLLGKFRP